MLINWNQAVSKENGQLKIRYEKLKMEAERDNKCLEGQIRIYNADNMKLYGENMQLKSDMERMHKDKADVMDALYKEKILTAAVTAEGEIDGQKVEIRGHLRRKGYNSVDPPGPCVFCKAMIELGSTELMIRYTTRC